MAGEPQPAMTFFFCLTHRSMRISEGEAMICAATGKRRGRAEVSESVKRCESLNRNSQVTHKTLSDVGKRLAKRRVARVDMPRCNSQQSDQDQRDLAIFRTGVGKLNEEDKNAIYGQYRRGTPVETLAHRYRSKKTCIRRVINEIRVGRIMVLPLDFIPNPQFSIADAESIIMTATPADDANSETTRIPSGLPPYLASLCGVSLLTREQECHLFRKFNYLKYKASKLRSQLDTAHAKRGVMDQIERLYEAAVAVKNQIMRANLRLVVSIAKRYVGPNGDLWELVSDGNISLMRAIDKFDFARGFKISTYASWAIMRNFARTIPHEQRHRGRFCTSHTDTFGVSEDYRSNEHDLESAQRQREAQVRKIMDRLDQREKQIVVSRFGLEHGQEPRTLEEIGAKLGVSKERVRQIEARAMNKLRIAASEENIELPGVN
jgi:RNA polymerase sigma factor (sigma-70 family)